MSGAESEDAIVSCSQDSEKFAAVGPPQLSSRLKRWKNVELTEVLKLNKVIHSGNKDKKVERIMSYYTYGVLPFCPKCNERVLKWSVREGRARAFCPGYWIKDKRHSCPGPSKTVPITKWNWGAKKPHVESVID